MLSSQVLKKTIETIGNIRGKACSIWDTEGNCLANYKDIGKNVLDWSKCEELSEKHQETDFAVFSVFKEDERVYFLVLEELEDHFEQMGQMGRSQLESLLEAYQEKMNKNRFFQNVLLDRFSPVEMYNQAKKIRVLDEQRRAVFVIEPKKSNDDVVMETLRGLYATGTKDFVTTLESGHLILIKALEKTESRKELRKTATSLVDTLVAEAMVDVRVAYGSIAADLKGTSKSYQEATLALEVGRVFFEERSIFAFHELGIGRLIHQLPQSLCKMFLEEVLSGNVYLEFDEETLAMIQTFFEHNLNISETARMLYVHRNTLVYRIEKLQKAIGLDIREFEDALTLKLAMMVAKHVESKNKKEKGVQNG